MNTIQLTETVGSNAAKDYQIPWEKTCLPGFNDWNIDSLIDYIIISRQKKML